MSVIDCNAAVIEERLRGEASVFPRPKGLAQWTGGGERIDLIANEASLRAEHLALSRFQVPSVNWLNRSALAEALFRCRSAEWATILFRQAWEVPT
jgi:hypothetical protein